MKQRDGKTIKSAHSGGARFPDFRFHLPRKQQNIRPIMTLRQEQTYVFPVGYNRLPAPSRVDRSCILVEETHPPAMLASMRDLEQIICCWICGGARVATCHKVKRTMFVRFTWCGIIFNFNVLACPATPHGVRCLYVRDQEVHDLSLYRR